MWKHIFHWIQLLILENYFKKCFSDSKMTQKFLEGKKKQKLIILCFEIALYIKENQWKIFNKLDISMCHWINLWRGNHKVKNGYNDLVFPCQSCENIVLWFSVFETHNHHWLRKWTCKTQLWKAASFIYGWSNSQLEVSLTDLCRKK